METTIPANAKPIVDFELVYNYATDQINEKGLPLCPHCGEWSYYTDDEADENGGYTICPFCGGPMFMRECKTCVWFKDWVKEKTIFDDFCPEWGTSCLNLDDEDWKKHPNPDPYDTCEHHVITRDHKPDPAWSMLVRTIAKAIEDGE